MRARPNGYALELGMRIGEYATAVGFVIAIGGCSETKEASLVAGEADSGQGRDAGEGPTCPEGCFAGTDRCSVVRAAREWGGSWGGSTPSPTA
jgi:hypothetical protein